MRVAKGKWKSDKFRPVIADDSGELRKRYSEVLKKSELNRVAFNRKLIEAGLAVLGDKYNRAEA